MKKNRKKSLYLQKINLLARDILTCKTSYLFIFGLPSIHVTSCYHYYLYCFWRRRQYYDLPHTFPVGGVVFLTGHYDGKTGRILSL